MVSLTIVVVETNEVAAGPGHSVEKGSAPAGADEAFRGLSGDSKKAIRAQMSLFGRNYFGVNWRASWGEMPADILRLFKEDKVFGLGLDGASSATCSRIPGSDYLYVLYMEGTIEPSVIPEICKFKNLALLDIDFATRMDEHLEQIYYSLSKLPHARIEVSGTLATDEYMSLLKKRHDVDIDFGGSSVVGPSSTPRQEAPSGGSDPETIAPSQQGEFRVCGERVISVALRDLPLRVESEVFRELKDTDNVALYIHSAKRVRRTDTESRKLLGDFLAQVGEYEGNIATISMKRCFVDQRIAARLIERRWALGFLECSISKYATREFASDAVMCVHCRPAEE